MNKICKTDKDIVSLPTFPDYGETARINREIHYGNQDNDGDVNYE